MRGMLSKKCFLRFNFTAVLLIAAFMFSACSGGGGEGYSTSYEPCFLGGVVIEKPTYKDSYSTCLTSILLYGIAPLASSGEPSIKGMTVIWDNDATGESGEAFSSLYRYWFFGAPIYSHRWHDRIPLLEGENLIKVTAYEDEKRRGRDCIWVTYIPDTTPPTIPTNLTVTDVYSSYIALSWDASTDDSTTDDAGVGEYKIYRDGTYLKTVSDLSASDAGLSPWTQYCYTVSAYDTAGNGSPQSTEVCVTTLDVTSPSVPTNFLAIAVSSTEIDLSWDASTDDVGVEGYKIYRDGIHIESTTATSFSDTGLISETRYCYTVSAYDIAGNESPQSIEICTDTSWATYTIQSAGDVGEFSSIAVDSTDSVHISYYNYGKHDLNYATNASGLWVTETIDTIDSVEIVGEFSSIAVDSTDSVHISYYNYGDFFWPSHNLKYATNVSGSWVINTIGSKGSGGWYTSIALDSVDNAHISYWGGSHELKYATNVSGQWVTETIDSDGIWTSIALDSSDKVHISYHDSSEGTLKYATNVSGQWVTETIDNSFGSNTGEFSSIAVDSSEKVHISYYGWCYSNYGLKYATNASGSWVINTIGSEGGKYTSIAVDSTDSVHISYLSGNLKYATNASGSWVISTIDRAVTVQYQYYGYYTSIAVDSYDRVHISYYGSDGNLKYATNQ